jgi:cell division septum initiation protein DivIVA
MSNIEKHYRLIAKYLVKLNKIIINDIKKGEPIKMIKDNNNLGSRLKIQRLLMELETYITQNTPVPFTNKVIVDKDAVYDLIDNIRAKLPAELKQCEKILDKNQVLVENIESEKQQILDSAEAEKAQIIAAAQKEAENIIAAAQEKLKSEWNETVSQETEELCRKMFLQAQKEAQQIIEQAQNQIPQAEEEAQRIIADAQNQISQAEEKARKIINSANSYVEELMDEFNQYLEQNVKLIRQGRTEIQQAKAALKRKK